MKEKNIQKLAALMMVIGVVMVASIIIMLVTFMHGVLVTGDVFEAPYLFLKAAAFAVAFNLFGYYFNKRMEKKYFEPMLE